MHVDGTKHNLSEHRNNYQYFTLHVALATSMNSIMFYKLSSGRSASSARLPLKLNTEAFEEIVVAGTDIKYKNY